MHVDGFDVGIPLRDLLEEPAPQAAGQALFGHVYAIPARAPGVFEGELQDPLHAFIGIVLRSNLRLVWGSPLEIARRAALVALGIFAYHDEVDIVGGLVL